MDTLQTRLEELRKDKGLSQEALAKILNMSQTGYSKYETGECDVSTELLITLANFYGVTTDYLLGISNDKK